MKYLKSIDWGEIAITLVMTGIYGAIIIACTDFSFWFSMFLGYLAQAAIGASNEILTAKKKIEYLERDLQEANQKIERLEGEIARTRDFIFDEVLTKFPH